MPNKDTQADAQIVEAETVITVAVSKATPANVDLPKLPADLVKGDRKVVANTPQDYYKALYGGFAAK